MLCHSRWSRESSLAVQRSLYWRAIAPQGQSPIDPDARGGHARRAQPAERWVLISRGGSLALGTLNVTDVDLRYANDKRGAFSSITEAANVGQQVLARFAVTFDYTREHMCLDPAPGYVPPPLARSGAANIKTEPDRFEVVSVVAGSSAASAGLQAGDVVTAVDGRPSRTLAGHDLFMLVRQPPGTTVRFTIKRGDETFEKAVVLKPL
jgi:hypothetical protein